MKILTFIISADGDKCEAQTDRREDALINASRTDDQDLFVVGRSLTYTSDLERGTFLSKSKMHRCRAFAESIGHGSTLAESVRDAPWSILAGR